VNHPSVNTCYVIWRVVNGVAHVILVPSIPKNPKHGLAVRYKIPGGGAEEGDKSSLATGRRETKEETGLSMKLRINPIFLCRTVDRCGHIKEAYLAPRSGFRGKPRDVQKEEKDSFLESPIEVSLDRALQIVFQTPKNKFHLNALLAAHDQLVARGVDVGPAKQHS
jgi:8-oxo-dGTP pyrophosphatase MutT (NUDIX family)